MYIVQLEFDEVILDLISYDTYKDVFVMSYHA